MTPFKFISNAYRYYKAGGKISGLYPCLFSDNDKQTYDRHYLLQDWWAMKRIIETIPQFLGFHSDIGSRLDFAAFLSIAVPVFYYDIRLPDMDLPRVIFRQASILNLPFDDNSTVSLSCLHVAEHIGLGRYGDEINPRGTEQACKELQRVLAVGGNLYFSVPIGLKPKVLYNGHRIHTVLQILKYFNKLNICEISMINQKGEFKKNCYTPDGNYNCGLFRFTKVG